MVTTRASREVRRKIGNPAVQRRISIVLVTIAGVSAGLGALIRASSGPGTARHSSGYLFDVAGWLLAIGGAIFEARAASVFLDFSPRPARRRALLLAILGGIAALGGCVLATFVIEDGMRAIAQAAAMFVLVGGIGAGLAGSASLAWHYGGEYAGKRIEKLGDEEW